MLAPKQQEEKMATRGKVCHKQQSMSDIEQKKMSIKSGANLVDSRKNHLKEDVPDFPKEARKWWGQDTKHQSTLWKQRL